MGIRQTRCSYPVWELAEGFIKANLNRYGYYVLHNKYDYNLLIAKKNLEWSALIAINC
jgi:hypothetical protein